MDFSKTSLKSTKYMNKINVKEMEKYENRK